MKSKKEIDKAVQRTLDVADNLKKVSSNPFLYEKIIHSMSESETKNQGVPLINSLAFKLAAFAVVLVLNITTLYLVTSDSATITESSDPIESLAEEYYLTTSDYDY
ncbi:MAG: hypothetical protein AAFX87_03105 [Bacteroidota bacterium]